MCARTHIITHIIDQARIFNSHEWNPKVTGPLFKETTEFFKQYVDDYFRGYIYYKINIVHFSDNIDQKIINIS